MSSTTATKSLPILIMGAGLGGLLLAQGLKKASIPFLIFERDTTPATRLQGYRIRISGEGIEALESTLPPELWTLFDQTCAHVKLGGGGGVINALDASPIDSGTHPTGRPLGPPQNPAVGGGRRRPYTPDRTVLRSVLMTGLDEHVVFGQEFTHYEATADHGGRTTVNAHFADGSVVAGALVVGADGSRSRVRKQLLGDMLRPCDTDGRVVYGKAPLSAELLGRMSPELLESMTLVEDKSTDGSGAPLSLLYEPIRFPQREAVAGLPDDYVYWVLISRSKVFGVPDEQLVRLTGEDAATVAKDVTKHWDPKLRAIFDMQDTSQTAALRVLSMRPELAVWAPLKEPATLIGDAAHVMSPSGGVGAVTAFRDAANLAKLLAENGGQVSAESVGKYEEMMRAYAAAAIQDSRRGGVRFFNHPPFEDCPPVDV